MGLMFLFYPADAPNKRGEEKQASIKKTWATHGIHFGLPKKSTLLSMQQLINKIIFLAPTFRANTFVLRIHITYMMTINRYYSDVSTTDAIKRLL